MCYLFLLLIYKNDQLIFFFNFLIQLSEYRYNLFTTLESNIKKYVIDQYYINCEYNYCYEQYEINTLTILYIYIYIF